MISNDSHLGVLISLIFFIIILIALALIFVYLLKNKKRYLHGNNTKEITRFYLNNKSFISIMEICNKFYILGVSENNISKLDEIEDEEIISKLMEEKKIDLASFLKKQNFESIYKKIKIKRSEENNNENSQ